MCKIWGGPPEHPADREVRSGLAGGGEPDRGCSNTDGEVGPGGLVCVVSGPAHTCRPETMEMMMDDGWMDDE